MEGIYRFINTNVPTVGCNLRCEYCYIKQHGDEDKVLKISAHKKLFEYPVDHMLRALTVRRMGGVCMFNISGSGETLLCPSIFEIVVGLLNEGHYVALISNCTITSLINKFAKMTEENKSRLFFKCSLHYRELKKLNMLDVFAENIKCLKKSSIAFSVEIVSNDWILDELDELKDYCMDNFGALPHVLAGRSETRKGEYPKFSTKLSNEEFFKVWSTFDSDLFSYQYTDYIIPHNDEFCYAGVYTGSLDLKDGTFFSCPGNKKITNFFESIDESIRFLPIGKACPFPYCFCGFFLQVLAGACNESYNPNVKFYQFRDRTCDDGTHWLTPKIKDVFSHKCSEFHKPYSKEKSLYLDALMQKYYNNITPTKDVDIELACIVRKYCKNNNINSVAIYGMGNLGKMLYSVLKNAGIKKIFGIDRNPELVSVPISTVTIEKFKEIVDVIIVSVFYEYTSIYPMLRRYTEIPVVSISDLVN